MLPISIVRSLTAGEPGRHPATGLDANAPVCPDLEGVRVVVVDDDQDALDLVKRVLEQCNAAVTVYQTGAECLKELTTHRPDVLITDIGMPGMDGYSLIKSVRALPADAGGTTPAIASPRTPDPKTAAAMLSGFDIHVARPVEPNELLAVVARLSRRA